MVVVRETLATSGFFFEAGFATVLTGEEEALYSLIAVNLLGTVQYIYNAKLNKISIK
jgi:hypothetical protein